MGSLINRGVSISHPNQANEHVLVRPADALPLTEFQLEKDMWVHGLPNETLLTFEGSSVERFWELSFPAAANDIGLDDLADILLTFDVFAEFAPERYGADLAALPNNARKWIMLSGAHLAPGAVADQAPLNAFANQDPRQSFRLTIDKASNPGVDFSRTTDVVLALEYSSTLG